ncbi:MAG: carbon-nitrogen hydrolase family protein [Gammaproteobacteria bacterium]
MNKPRQLRVGIAQLAARSGDPRGQLARLESMLWAHRVDLVLLPELALTGYVSETMDFDRTAHGETLSGPTATACAGLARRHRVALAAPLVERDGQQHYNSLLLFNAAGERIGHWRKRHPWYPERWASAGNLDNTVVTLHGVRLCAAICFDIHFLASDAAAALADTDLLLFPSAWVEHPDSRPQMLAALAREHRTAIANANWGLGTPAIYGQGRSLLIDAGGHPLAATPAQSADAWCDGLITTN